jgi:urea transporter
LSLTDPPRNLTPQKARIAGRDIPEPVLIVLRGVGQVFFQEQALTGLLFVIGIALSSPLMACGAVIGSIVGTFTAKALKFDEADIKAGIYGFNACLVGIAMLFFFEAGISNLVLIVIGAAAATALTYVLRRFVPIPTYTSAFILVTWGLYFLAKSLGMSQVGSDGPPIAPGLAAAVARGIGQVMFQGSVWTGILFLVGIAISDWQHAILVVVGSVLGMAIGAYHHDSSAEIAALGIFGYNATLAAVALYLNRRSLLGPLLGIMISVPLIELFPLLGLPALTAPFVLATWLVLMLQHFERKLFHDRYP